MIFSVGIPTLAYFIALWTIVDYQLFTHLKLLLLFIVLSSMLYLKKLTLFKSNFRQFSDSCVSVCTCDLVFVCFFAAQGFNSLKQKTFL